MSGPFDQTNTPWPSNNNGVGALINPFGGVPDPGSPGTFYKQTPVSEPTPWLPYRVDNQIGFFNRWYVIEVINEAANTEVIRTLQVDIPGFVYEVVGGAVSTNATALPVGTESRDTFLMRLDYSQNSKLITSQALGSTVCGTAGFPAKVGLSGWKFNRGSSAIFGITPLVANLRINIVLKYIELQAGANFGSLG